MIHNALSEKNLRLELGARLVGGSDEIKKKKEINFPHKSCVSVTLVSFSRNFPVCFTTENSTLEAPLFVE